MSYSNPIRLLYPFGMPFDFGGGSNEVFSIQGPKGKSATLWDYGVYGVTEAFAGTTSTPAMSVGDADPDAYGEEFDFGALADNSGKSVRQTYAPHEATFATYILNSGYIAADTEIVTTCVAAVGSPTGMAIPFTVLEWSN